jgi:hypothetical protein
MRAAAQDAEQPAHLDQGLPAGRLDGNDVVQLADESRALGLHGELGVRGPGRLDLLQRCRQSVTLPSPPSRALTGQPGPGRQNGGEHEVARDPEAAAGEEWKGAVEAEGYGQGHLVGGRPGVARRGIQGSE